MDFEVPTQPSVIWLTGLSGAGKTTIAEKLCSRLKERGVAVEHLDGDEIRSLFPNVGFSREDRDMHVRRVGHVAQVLEKHNVSVVASLVSPYRESRNFVRSICRNFIEVHISTSIEECERRDPKGLYAKARRGELKAFTGVSDPYEAPDAPELIIDTQNISVEAAVGKILERIHGSS